MNWNNKEEVLEKVKQKGRMLNFVDFELRDDSEIVWEAVKNDGTALKYASSRLRDDSELVKMAVQKKGKSLQYASNRLKKDLEIVLLAVKNDGLALGFSDATLLENKSLALEAVKNNGWALQITRSFRDDADVVMEAVKNNGEVLQFASEKLQNEPELVLVAVKNNEKAFEYIGEELRNNTEFMKQVQTILEDKTNKQQTETKGTSDKEDIEPKQELINQIIIAKQKGKELDKKIAEVKSHSPYSHYETKQETYKKKNIKNPEYFQQIAQEEKENPNRIIKADIKNNENKITFESTKKEHIINDYIEEEER